MRKLACVGLLVCVLAIGAGAAERTMTVDVVISNDIAGVSAPAVNPYVYDFAGDNLNMAGHKIYYNVPTMGGVSRSVVLTNLTELTDSVGTARIDTSSDAEYSHAGAASIYAALRVLIGGYITTAGRQAYWGYSGGAVIVVAPSIAIGGTNSAGLSIDARGGNSSSGGPVTLATTNLILAGGLAADGPGGIGGGAISISDGAGGPAETMIAGDLTTAGNGGGAITVRGSSVTVSNINTRATYEYSGAGTVMLSATNTLTVNGYITTKHTTGNGAAVTLSAVGSIAVNGVTNGISVETRSDYSSGNYAAGNIAVTSTNGSITIAGGFDASHASGQVSRRGDISLSATNGSITIGSLDANLFKTISFRAGYGRYDSVYVSGIFTNFTVSELPKKFTFSTGCVISNDVYYCPVTNGVGLVGIYQIHVAAADTGKLLKEGPPPRLIPGTIITLR